MENKWVAIAGELSLGILGAGGALAGLPSNGREGQLRLQNYFAPMAAIDMGSHCAKPGLKRSGANISSRPAPRVDPFFAMARMADEPPLILIDQ